MRFSSNEIFCFPRTGPITDVRLDTTHKLLDLPAQGVAVGLRYGAGRWAGLLAEKLMEEEIYPVCSPALLRHKRLRAPADLGGVTLIHDLSVQAEQDFATWDTWFKQAGVALRTAHLVAAAATLARRRHRLNPSMILWQAAG